MKTILLLLLISSFYFPGIPALIQDQINSQRGATGSTFLNNIQRDSLFHKLSLEADIKPSEFTETFRGDVADLFNTEVTFEDLQFTASVDHHQLTGQPLLQAKKNSTVQQHVCGQENVCDDEIESERQSVQWKDVSNIYDWQNIVALGDDPVVLQAASSLFERNPSVSTLLHYHKGQTLLLKGSGSRLTSDSRVTLVGHGVKGSDGIGRLGGYGAEELATLVSTMGTQIRTVSLVGCELGKDLQFAERLLRELRSLGVESRLHLHSALLSVSLSGETLSKDEEDGVWRLGDDRTKVTAQLDQTGKLLTRVEGGRRGRTVPYYQGHALLDREWPKRPTRFLPEAYQESQPLELLEALAWAIFIDGDNQKSKTFSRVNQITWKPDNNNIQWTQNSFSNNDKIFIISSINDVVREIRRHAKENIENIHRYVFYKLNQYIYRVDTRSMYVHLVGRVGNVNEAGFEGYRATTYDEILNGLGINKGRKFHYFCSQTFKEKRCYQDCYRLGHYFMAAVFAESVRNFRQFALFLLSTAACDPIDDQTEECKLFVNGNPMARGGSWIEWDKRGFYGWDSNNNNLMEVLDMERDLRERFCFQIQSIQNTLKSVCDHKQIVHLLNGLQILRQPGVIRKQKYGQYCAVLKYTCNKP